MSHVPGRDDATPIEIKLRAWKTRWPHYIRVHHAEFVAGSLNNGVPMSDLMNTLGPDSFRSTQQNRIRGAGNVDPRAAFRQQAAVRLSNEGAAWLNSQLEQRLEICGRIPVEQLEALDWPTFA
jgi:hypothetical protein